MSLLLDRLSVARGGRTLLADLSLAFHPGTISVLAGPNGAGKSSLMAVMAGDLAPASGQVRINGQPLHAHALAYWASRRAMLRQQSEIAFGFLVADVVAMGLHPHGIVPESADGRLLVHHALADLDLLALASRPATGLSGGETQRTHIARVLVQARAALAASHANGILLLLDEPTTGLDYRHQLALVRILKAMADAGATVICSLHDLPLACRLADRLLLLGEGRLMVDVPPSALSAGLVARLYGIPESEAARLLGHFAQPLDAAA